MRFLVRCGLAVLLTLALTATGEAINWKVGVGTTGTCDGPCDFDDSSQSDNGHAIRTALGASFVVPGDTLTVWPGNYPAKLNMKSGVTVISRYGPAGTRLVGTAGLEPAATFVACSGSTVLDGFTVDWTGTDNSLGGGIRAFVSDGAVKNCIIRECQAGIGAGIYLQTSDLIVENNLFLANECSFGGGVIAISGGSPVLRSNTIVDCMAPLGSDGAGIYIVGAACTLDRNVIMRSRGGSALFCDGASNVDLTCNLFYDNDYGPFGGTCVDSTGTSGNIVVDPQYCDPDYGPYPDFGNYNVCETSLTRTTACGAIGYVDPAGEARCGACEATSVGSGVETASWGLIKAFYR